MHFHNTYCEEGLEEQAAELAQLILYMQNRKKKCIKVPNIRKWENCIEKTIDVLEEVIGVKVYKTKTSDGYQLYVKNALQIQHDTSDENYCYSDENKAKYGLLIAILMFIYMMHRPGSSTYSVSESSLRNFLEELGIGVDSCFGDQAALNKLLGASSTAEFISQGWLTFTKEMDESGSDIITYEWGPRAKAFVDPMAILRAYSIIDGSAPRH